jgi:hypothetical protein
MGLLAHVLRLSGPTHGRSPYSSLLSPGDIVPMVPNLIRATPHSPVQGLGRGSHQRCLASSQRRRVSAVPDEEPHCARHFLPSIESSCAWLPSTSFTCAGPSPSRSPPQQSLPPLGTPLSPVRTSLSPSPHLLTHPRSL